MTLLYLLFHTVSTIALSRRAYLTALDGDVTASTYFWAIAASARSALSAPTSAGYGGPKCLVDPGGIVTCGPSLLHACF
jgi:hypothetical protein